METKMTNIVDVFVYIHSKGMTDVISNIAEHISHTTGVATASAHPKVKQLLAVEYDPTHTSGKDIMSIVKQHGYSGFLVGM